MTDLKECVSGRVTFQYYRDGELWYECDNGFRFPVPATDTGSATFLREDKGILFMRWIRKWIEEMSYDGEA